MKKQIKILKDLIKEIEKEKIPIRAEEINGKEKELLIEVFGEARTPEFLKERRLGYNSALLKVQKIIHLRIIN